MFTKENVNKFRGDLQTAVAELERKYDCKVMIGGIRYSADLVSTRIEARTTTQLAKLTHLQGVAIGDKYCTPDFKTIVITGYNSRAKKSPWIGELNGRGVKFGTDYLTTCTKF